MSVLGPMRMVLIPKCLKIKNPSLALRAAQYDNVVLYDGGPVDPVRVLAYAHTNLDAYRKEFGYYF